MATIALIWELGSDYGHIGRFLPIAIGLKHQGHRPILVLRDVSRAEQMLGPHGIEYVQAPVWLTPVTGLPPPANFTETLFLFGFAQPDALLSIARAWRKLLELIRPDLLIFDHAPTALLATLGLGIPRIVTGNSFAVPPQQHPLPPYRWWETPPPLARLIDGEKRAVQTANQVLFKLDAPPVSQISDLYRADATMITGIPALDVYGPRPDTHYIGPVNSIDHGIEPVWPNVHERKIFAYLKPRAEHFEDTLKALQKAAAESLVFAPGISGKLKAQYESPKLIISTEPY